jgi:hypothetical protein
LIRLGGASTTSLASARRRAEEISDMKLSRLMLGLVLAVSATALSLTGCASHDDAARENDGSYGTVVLSLTGQTNGTTYRLRQAIFDVAGPTNATLNSESDPNGAVLAATLSTGGYLITLRDGWFLERLTGMTAEPVDATLISNNPQMFGISSATTSTVLFRFETDGTIIDIGTGQLEVAIEVNETGATGCDIMQQTGCSMGEGCYFGGGPEGLTPICIPAGMDPPGSACMQQNSCAPGAFCGSFDGETVSCITICAVSGMGPTCPAGQACAPVGVGDIGGCL